MTSPFATIAILLSVAVSESLGGPETILPTKSTDETTEAAWDYSFSISTYLVQHARDYADPIFTADHDWLHLEARYNYEAIKTASLWLGYNFSAGEKLSFEATPMIGAVFGDITGVAPGYTISITYEPIEFFTQGEYFFDGAIQAGNFFYSWSELSYSPARWLRIGLVVDRTKAFGSDLDIRRGPLIGFKYKKLDLSTYWLSPGSRDATFVFAVTSDF